MSNHTLTNQSREEALAPAKVIVNEGELDSIAAWAAEYPGKETGGDLFGFFTHTGQPVVQHVIGPGPKARRSRTSFYQDGEYLRCAGKVGRERHGLQHVGEWHHHHGLGLAEPSGGDMQTVTKALREYELDRFLLVITNNGHAAGAVRIRLNAFLFDDARHGRWRRCGWVILPGESPVRKDLAAALPFVVHAPRLFDVRWVSESRTTLEAPLARPASVPRGSWLAAGAGRTLLRALHARLGGAAGSCRMLQQEDGRIALSVDRDCGSFRVVLPDDFPESAPSIHADGRIAQTVEPWKGVDPVNELEQAILALEHETTSTEPSK